MRHVVVKPTDEGLGVIDMFSINNPSDRTWLGAAGADGKRITLTVPVPASAGKVDFGGPNGAVAEWQGGKVLVSMPLRPGDSQFHLIYYPKEEGGASRLALTAPVKLAAMMVMVPKGMNVEVQGLSRSEMQAGEQLGQEMYRGENIPAGKEMLVVISSAAKDKPSAFASMPKLIAIVGGGLILIVGAGIMLMKGRSKAAVDEAHRPRG